MKVFEADVIEALKTVHDPEIPVNVYDLGLVYDIAIDGDAVAVTMTLTTPNCPEAQSIPAKMKAAILQQVPGVQSVTVEVVWEPKWDKSMMSEDAQLALDFF